MELAFLRNLLRPIINKQTSRGKSEKTETAVVAFVSCHLNNTPRDHVGKAGYQTRDQHEGDPFGDRGNQTEQDRYERH